MRYIMVFVLAALVAGGTALYLTQSASPSKKPDATSAAQTAELTERERRLQELEAENRRAEAEKENLLRLTKEMGTQLEAQSRALTNRAASRTNDASKSSAGFGKMVSSMFKDPETRKFIREQQRMLVSQLYEPLATRLKLSPEKSEQLQTIILENMMQSAEKGMAMFSAGSDSQNRDEAVKALSEDRKALETQLRELLGEEGYAQYQDYSITLQERTQLNTFRQQMGGNSISDEQAELLLSIMREEKQNPNNGLPDFMRDGDKGPEAMKTLFDKDQMTKLLEAQERLNQRVSERAGEVLGPDQLNAFSRFQTNQLNMMRMGLTMAQKMFGGEEQAPTPGTTGN